MNVEISECIDLNSLMKLFSDHHGEPFVYSADTQLFKLFSRSESCRAFEAEICGKAVGSIYAMKYMYGCGWLGGLLVDEKHRRKGIGRKLLDEALRWLNVPYAYAFVDPRNNVARQLFEKAGFNALYRRLNYRLQASAAGRRKEEWKVDCELKWEELVEATGFRERGGIVNLGYYPARLTKDVFDDLKNKERVQKSGDIIAIVSNSYIVGLDGYTFIFNDHILMRMRLATREKIVEINPFYVEPEPNGLIKIIDNVAGQEVAIWTYEGDPVTSRLPLKGSLATLVYESRHDGNERSAAFQTTR